MDQEPIEKSTSCLLLFLLSVKLLFLLISTSFVVTALIGDDTDFRQYSTHSSANTRDTLLAGGLAIGLVSVTAGLAIVIAIIGLHSHRRFLLLPYLGLLLFGALFSLIYLVGSIYLWSFQQELNVLAMCGTLACSALLLRLAPVFLLMAAPPYTNSLEEGNAPALAHPNRDASALERPPSLISSDSPPRYETLEVSLPGYDDSIVEKVDQEIIIVEKDLP